MEFVKEDLKQIKDFLDKEQAKGNQYVVYPGDEPLLRRWDLECFKTEDAARENVQKHSSYTGEYEHNSMANAQFRVDQSIQKNELTEQISQSNIVERFDKSRVPLMVDVLMSDRPIYVHVQDTVTVQDKVNQYEVVAHPGKTDRQTSHNDIKVISEHGNYADAEKAFANNVQLDKQKPEAERSNYTLIGRFEGVKPNMLESGQPVNGTGVTMKFAYQCYDTVKDQMDYAVATVHNEKDTVPIYKPRWVTAEPENKTLQYHENKPEKAKEREEKTVFSKEADKVFVPSGAPSGKKRDDELAR
ncbi:hypothetical protein HNQ91_002985 [Filimonas zeae]|uniref:Uncharacterized protein n=1 Tax=Filimonas zeae TaxID=1737353 RepID=A0A917IY61_9BACT|nr:hypothetical protein [Filimonas zeae]MDR6339920.1 hypothetical protein [Filimonas zeae]GGH70307.1 hypothetical protein GCM10011379_28440 [Filimonas zeae]